MERFGGAVAYRMPVELMRELEMQKINATIEITKAHALLQSQSQLGAVWLTTPGDSKGIRIRQALGREGESPLVLETMIELL